MDAREGGGNGSHLTAIDSQATCLGSPSASQCQLASRCEKSAPVIRRHPEPTGTSIIASLTITADPPTRTAVISPSDLSTSSSRMLGLLISKPCSTTYVKFPLAALSLAP